MPAAGAVVERDFNRGAGAATTAGVAEQDDVLAALGPTSRMSKSMGVVWMTLASWTVTCPVTVPRR